MALDAMRFSWGSPQGRALQYLPSSHLEGRQERLGAGIDPKSTTNLTFTANGDFAICWKLQILSLRKGERAEEVSHRRPLVSNKKRGKRSRRGPLVKDIHKSHKERSGYYGGMIGRATQKKGEGRRRRWRWRWRLDAKQGWAMRSRSGHHEDRATPKESLEVVQRWGGGGGGSGRGE